MKKQYIVTLNLPNDVSTDDGAEYICEALQFWSQQFRYGSKDRQTGDKAVIVPIKLDG